MIAISIDKVKTGLKGFMQGKIHHWPWEPMRTSQCQEAMPGEGLGLLYSLFWPSRATGTRYMKEDTGLGRPLL